MGINRLNENDEISKKENSNRPEEETKLK